MTNNRILATTLFTLCSLILFPSLAVAQEKPVIYWPYFNLPPQFIIGKTAPEGMGIDVARLLQNKMPEYKHIFIHMTPRRIEEELRKGSNNIVVTGLLKTPSRTPFAVFSQIPCRLTYTMMVVMRKEDRARFATNDKVSLNKLLADDQLYLGYIPGVHYGPFAETTDPVISQSKTTNVFAAHDLDQLLLMLKEKRIDWFVHDSLGAWHAIQKHNLDARLALIEAEGYPPSPIYGFLATSRTPIGKVTMQKLNHALEELIKNDTMRQELKRWMPKALWPSFKEAYENAFVQPMQQKYGKPLSQTASQ